MKMKALGLIGINSLITISNFLTFMLTSYVLLSVSNLYGLTFITNFSFIQICGMLIIFKFLRVNLKLKKIKDLRKRLLNSKNQTKLSEEQQFKKQKERTIESALKLFINILILMFFWASSFAIFHILH